MKKQVLVTGAAGFIASHVAEEFVRRGHPVTVLDNFSTGFKRNLKPFLKSIRLVKGDVQDFRAVRKAMRGVDIVSHHAAIRSVPKSVNNPLISHHANATGTLVMLECARELKVRRFIFASSSSVYGNVLKFPQREDNTTLPISPYGASKLAGEYYCHCYYYNFGLETVSLRYFNVYGARMNVESSYSLVVPAFIDSLMKGKPPVVEGTGRQSRDFTYVKDVAEANVKAAFADSSAAGHTYNIADGKDYSILNLLKIISRHMGKTFQVSFAPGRKGDVYRTWADVSKAGKLLKWKPRTSFEDGLKETVKWFAEVGPDIF